MYPFITLGRFLQVRGHQVLMLAPAFRAALVEAAGLPCRSFSSSAAFQSMLDDPALWDERRGWGGNLLRAMTALDGGGCLCRRIA